MNLRLSLAILAPAFLLAGCSRKTAPEPYVPGLGEIMTLNQMRHTKLWLAGEARNWDLAAYELDELKEGFDDAAKYHPTHKNVPLPIPGLIDRIMKVPLADLGKAIQARDPKAFETAYDSLTAGCNSCHQAANFGFNVVQRPAGNPFPNQVFAPAAR